MQDPIPALFLTTSLVLGGENGQYAPVTLRAECILFGPVIQGANAHLLRNVTLNMGRQPNILQLAVRGRLLISHLVSSSGLAAAWRAGGRLRGRAKWAGGARAPAHLAPGERHRWRRPGGRGDVRLGPSLTGRHGFGVPC